VDEVRDLLALVVDPEGPAVSDPGEQSRVLGSDPFWHGGHPPENRG